MLHSDIAVFHLNQIWRNTNAFRTKCREYFYINHEKVVFLTKIKTKDDSKIHRSRATKRYK